jgi:hypothetical protein
MLETFILDYIVYDSLVYFSLQLHFRQDGQVKCIITLFYIKISRAKSEKPFLKMRVLAMGNFIMESQVQEAQHFPCRGPKVLNRVLKISFFGLFTE